MIRLYCILIGYVFGCFQTSFLYGKKQGIDIRQHGSGNAGTTNALRVMGTKAGVITFMGDLGKMLLACLVTWLLFRHLGTDYRLLRLLYTGVGVIIGHDFPLFMSFKGGKGIAATGGLMLLISPWTALYGFLSFFGLTALTKIVSLGSCLMVTGEWIVFLVLCLTGTLNTGVMTVWEAVLVFSFFTFMALIRHKDNIRRLLRGEENKLRFHA
ncbi:MAG: glycerol-3-phosphate 1-O-acyltransferase PlsY [Lachnospiraceae bacterium]|nr:glycerol-3-phosphate 1-O-acyltransferase PlsY [Lachnospiraceae bacterium]